MTDTAPPTAARGALTYADAGVDIAAGNALVERIKPHVARTRRPGVLGGIGGFGGLFELPVDRYREPVMVSGADGVGTKLRLAIELDRHDTIGIDLVAMCVNDILVTGAEPLWFLDYYASGRLDLERATSVIAGIARGCEIAGAALLGGETAEMPGLYAGNDYDLAGFAVGVVEKAAIIDGGEVRAGDAVIGLASSGPHSNGYSLIRRLLEGEDLDRTLPDGRALGEALIAPTRIYVPSVRALLARGDVPVHALAHVTGGGLTENLPRVLPPGTLARVDLGAWPLPAVFAWLRGDGRDGPAVAEDELLRTFNAGIGMALVVPAEAAERAVAALADLGETAWVIGAIEPDAGAGAEAGVDVGAGLGTGAGAGASAGAGVDVGVESDGHGGSPRVEYVGTLSAAPAAGAEAKSPDERGAAGAGATSPGGTGDPNPDAR